MTIRIIIFLLASLLIASCTFAEKSAGTGKKEQEILYIYPDGTMQFKDRIMNKKDVVIYADGRGGERAAIRLMSPLHPDVFRDTIVVEREEVDVPVLRKK